MDARPRLVPLTGAFNFRDLGGYPALGGRTTRWGTLFRSDTLHELTGSDVEAIASLGVATIIDLRTNGELERTGRGPLVDRPIGFHHLSVLSELGGSTPSASNVPGEAVAAPDAAREDQGDRYLWYLEVGRRSLAGALGIMAAPGRLPLVFHCAAGKDRTGVLAALVLDILGVAAEVIVADYMLTEERMPMIMERYRSDPALAERMATVPLSRFTVNADAMERFLDGLHRNFGGARSWAEEAGVAPADLDRMVDLLLEPS